MHHSSVRHTGLNTCSGLALRRWFSRICCPAAFPSAIGLTLGVVVHLQLGLAAALVDCPPQLLQPLHLCDDRPVETTDRLFSHEQPPDLHLHTH